MEAAAAKQAEQDESDLKRMSFGDHLEELRRRMFFSLIAVGVCVFAVLPFKQTVTAIYVQPYREVWYQFFEDWVVHIEQSHAELLQRLADAPVGQRAALETRMELVAPKYRFLQKHAASIRDGSFPFVEFADDIRTGGGLRLRYALVATGGIEDFWTFMAASFLFSLIVASPFVLYQIWAFIAAGLYKRERRMVTRYLPFSALLLASGVLFGYLVVVPFGLYFLIQLMNFGQVTPMLSVSQYFSLLFTLTAALGFVFQFPLVMLALQKVGMVSHHGFRKHWRYVVLGLFLVSAVMTPPEPITQILMAVPMIGLYALGLVLTYYADKKRAVTEPTLS